MDDTQTKSKTSKYIKYGCGIGCGAILLVVIILVGMVYYLVKDSIKAFEETEKSLKLLVKQYGNVGDYCPEPEGAIKPERMEAFLAVRESSIPLSNEVKQSLFQILEEIRRAEEEDQSFSDAIGLIKRIAKAIPHLARYFTARNRKLMEVGMGLGEYYYIYVIAYYSWLGISPSDGPDFGFLEGGGKNSSFYFAMQEMLKEKEKEEESRDTDSWEAEEVGSIARVRGFFLPMMKWQLQNLKSGVLDEDLETWRQALESEIEKMDENRKRIPWQDGLPDVITTSLQPFRERLKACYGDMMNPLEFGLSRD
jgi:hypothetical protein